MTFRPFRELDETNKRRRAQIRRWRLRRVYGIEEHEFEEMMQRQSGKCAVLSCPNRAEFIDHDHKTGGVRGLLCIQCNSLLGMAKDDPGILRDAAKYIELHRKRKPVLRKPLPVLPKPKQSPEEREWRRQLMLGNSRGKGNKPWNKGTKLGPEGCAKLKDAFSKWWGSRNEEQREEMRNHGRRGAQKRWDSLNEEQRKTYQKERQESLNNTQREILRVGREKRWKKV